MCRISLRIVEDIAEITCAYLDKLIFPYAVVLVGYTVLRQDITVVVVSERITVGEILLPPTVSSLNGDVCLYNVYC